MFAVDDGERGLIDAGIAVDPMSLHQPWLKTVSASSTKQHWRAQERLDAAGRP